MVFGWGKKKPERGQPDETPQEKEIKLSKIPQVLAELCQLRESQTLSDVRRLRDGTEPLVEDLMKIGRVLEKDDLSVDDIDKHLAIIVVRGKKQVIDIIKKGITHLPEVSSIEDAEKLNSLLVIMLKKVGDVLGRQTRVIHIFAKKYANHLKENLEVMNSNQSAIGALLQNHSSEKTLSDEISNTLDQIRLLRKIRAENDQKADNADRDKKITDERISTTQESIAKAKSSDRYKKYLALEEELNVFGSQKSKIKNEIDAQFTKISRPLNRYEYGSSLDKEQKNILTCLIADPFDVLSPQNTDSIIMILENVRKGILSGSISVKDVEKSMSQITETEEMLGGFVRQISKYSEMYQKIRTKMDSLQSGEITSLERDLAKHVSSAEDLVLKSKTLRSEIDEIDSKIPSLVSRIEQSLRKFSNTRYTVVDDFA